MNKNMEAIEKEITRLKNLKHKNHADMTEEEKKEYKFMMDCPNFGSLRYFSPSGEVIDNAVGFICHGQDRHIGDDIIGHFLISTVWLGMDHSHNRWAFSESQTPHAPLIFETMIFYDSDEENPFKDYQQRYSTIEEAEKGHDEAVEMVKKYINK